jgi:hypothetical protein
MVEMRLSDIANGWYYSKLFENQWQWFTKRLFHGHRGCYGWSFANDAEVKS